MVKIEVIQAVSGDIKIGVLMANEKVLIIDDEEKIINLVTSYLEREGYEIYTAQDGLAGLDLVKKLNLTSLYWISCSPAWMVLNY